jgi:hypothetical protein
MRYGILLCVLAFSGAGCYVGKRAETAAVAQGPVGSMADVALTQGTARGELFAVEESGLLLLRDRTLLVVPYSTIRQVSFPEVGVRHSLGQRPPDAEVLRAMRLISHFPQGIPVAAVAKLRSMYATDTISR